jgi:RNA polymerase sigma-70 factor (sigma-E family)
VYQGVSISSITATEAPAPPLTAEPEPYTSSFETYVLEHGASLARLAFLLTVDHQLAEDLVQTTLAKVALRWDQVAASGHPGGYVRRALVRTAIGWRRRHWHAERPAATVPDTAGRDHLAAVDDHDRLRRALLALPPRQRATVVLRFYEDRPEAEVASILRCSVGTIKSQTAKGLARLRILLDESPSSPQSGVAP